ncbi:MAG: YhcH/YjgK/YiaL family protein [Bacteroidales bacterium]
MVADYLNNYQGYSCLNKSFIKAFEYIRDTDFSTVAPGKIEIEGDMVFALVSEYKTKDPKTTKPEKHLKYIDIQYIVSGSELIGYAPYNNQKPVVEYNPEKDIAFFDEEVSFIKMETRMFAIFFTEDIHQPCIQLNETGLVKKVVIKVKVI